MPGRSLARDGPRDDAGQFCHAKVVLGVWLILMLFVLWFVLCTFLMSWVVCVFFSKSIFNNLFRWTILLYTKHYNSTLWKKLSVWRLGQKKQTRWEDLQKWFQALSADDINSMKPMTFRSCYVTPGDLVYLPAGMLVTEKSVQADNLVLRVTSTFMSEDQADSTLFFCGASGFLDLTVWGELLYWKKKRQ